MTQGQSGTGVLGELGLSIVQTQVLADLRWLIRPQPSLDFGIDAQVEVVENGQATGRLLALQVKTGTSFFEETYSEGWVFRFSRRHAGYWLAHALPVVVVIVEPNTRKAYWQRVTASTAIPTGEGFKLLIPREQTIPTAALSWGQAASGLEEKAVSRYRSNLEVLPPSCRTHLRELERVSFTSAAISAMHLADGRTTPQLILESLQLASPPWLSEVGPAAWLALAAYASEHSIPDIAADGYLRAAAADPSRSGRLRAAAGLQMLQIDRGEARRLLREAMSEPGGALLSRVGLVMADQPENDARPFDLPDDLDLQSDEAEADPTIQAFLGLQAERGRDVDEAVLRYGKALHLRPENSSFMTALAGVLGLRSSGSRRRPDDLEKASDLARKAFVQRQQWDGDSVEPLLHLLRCLVLRGDFDEAIRLSFPPPNGVAREREAASPRVARYAFEVAQLVGRRDLVESLVNDPRHAALQRILSAPERVQSAETAEEAHAVWLEVLDEAEVAEDYEVVASTVMRLADLGRDETRRLEPLADVGIVSESLLALARASYLARQDLDLALPTLRSLADTDVAAAEKLIMLLDEAGRSEEAVAECTRVYSRLGLTELLTLRAELQESSGRTSEAEVSARIALSNPKVIGESRARMHRLLGYQAADREDWATVEQELLASLDNTHAPAPSVVWQLIQAQALQGRLGQMAAVLERFDPEIRNEAEAWLWLRVVAGSRWDTATASRALVLANRFADDPQLSGALLTQLISSTRSNGQEAHMEVASQESPSVGDDADARHAVPGELRRQAFEALSAHIDRHGEAAVIRRVDASPEELIEELGHQLEAQSHGVRELLDQIRMGHLPLGVIATALNRSYSLAVVQRAAGVQVAATSSDELHDLELETATEALNAAVVVEPSALMLAAACRVVDKLRGQFSDLLIPVITLEDIVRASVEARGLTGSTGSLTWDEARGQVTFVELSPFQRALLHERAEMLERTAQRASPRGVNDLPSFEGFTMSEAGPWLAPIELAKSTGSCLWSDDVALRQLARSVGVGAFSTPCLFEAITRRQLDVLARTTSSEDGAIDELLKTQSGFVRQLLAEFVVDLPVTLDDLRAQGEIDDWHAAAAAVPLSRAAWWAWEDDPISELLLLYREVSTRQPAALHAWQDAAFQGVAWAYSANPKVASAMLAALAMLGFSVASEVDEAKRGLERAGLLAKRVGLPDPWQEVPQAAQILSHRGHLDDPAEFLAELLHETPD